MIDWDAVEDMVKILGGVVVVLLAVIGLVFTISLFTDNPFIVVGISLGVIFIFFFLWGYHDLKK